MFRAIRLTKNVEPNKYSYSGYDIGFDAYATFSLSIGDRFCKNIIIVGVDTGSNNRKKDILILGKGPADGLNDIAVTAEARYPISFSEQENKFYLSLHYKGNNSILFVNGIIYQFKAKDSEINSYKLF